MSARQRRHLLSAYRAADLRVRRFFLHRRRHRKTIDALQALQLLRGPPPSLVGIPMILRPVFLAPFAALALVAGAAGPVLAQSAQDGPIVTAPGAAESGDSQRLREAVAYANPLPRGAPELDYPLVAWCEALVNGHVALGETLTDRDPLDLDIIRLGKLEAADFHGALAAAESRQSAASRAAARAAAAEAAAKWTPLMDQDEAVRSQAFGLFFGLPGRCEHAARRIRAGVTTAPATPAEVGLEPAAPPAN
jgi:hypothetical protein